VNNEKDNIRPLYDRLLAVVSSMPEYEFRILFVDDGSTDGTLAEIESVMETESIVGYVQLSENFGHQRALEAGIGIEGSDAIITMDGDLQHPPEMIPHMLRAYERGVDVVQMQRRNLTEDIKGILSISFYSFFRWASHIPIVKNAADFRLISAAVRAEILGMDNSEKLLRAIIPTLGFKQVNIEYTQESRHAGEPSYSYIDSYELAIRTIFNFSKFPAHFIFISGMIIFPAGIISLPMKNLLHIGDATIAILIVGGLILIATGVICWYLYFILEKLKRDPSFRIQKVRYPRQSPNA
jgi:dolichol-phosphate mannosyltransferase